MNDTPRPGRPWQAALWWLLVVAGAAAMLVLTHAGRSVGYQHFAPLGGDGAIRRLARAVLAMQGLLVLTGLFVHRTTVARVLGALLPGWRLPLVLIACVLTGATVSRDPGAYAAELGLAALAQLAQLVSVAFAVAATPGVLRAGLQHRGTRWLLGPASEAIEPGGPDRAALAVAVWTVVVAYVLAVAAYQRIPHIPDEVVYLLHGRYFAAGLLTMPAPPTPDAFSLDLMTLEATRWFSPVPPGWPAILGLGVLLGEPWLVNPLLAGLSVLLSSMLLRELYPRRTARIAVLLMGASPWALFMAMNLTTHTASLACALLAALAVARLRRGGALAWAVAGGVMIGIVSLIRPLEGLAVALLLGVWSLRARWRRLPLVPSAVLTMVTMATGALTLPYNRLLTGSATIFPIMAYTDRLFGPGTNALGFGPDRGLGWSGLDPFPGHGWRDVLVNTNLNVFQVNTELLGWGCGSLLAVWLLVASGRLRRPDWMMIAVIACIAGLHAFYWFAGGPDFGARYWYLILVPALTLAARGMEETEATLRTRADPTGGAGMAAAALTLVALVVFVPWRATDKYWHYRGMRPDVRELAEARGFGASLVVVRGNRHPDYHGAAVFNPVDLRADAPVYAWDRGPDVRERLLAAYGDRPVWILDGPTRTGGGYRVVAGPLSTARARARLAAP